MTVQPTGPAAASRSGKWTNVKLAAFVTVAFVAFIWVVEAVDFALPIDMDQWGIQGWSLTGLIPGMFLAPVLHVGFGHVLGNTVPMLLLGFFAAVKGLGRFFTATAVIVVIHGVGVWLTSPGVVTVGASGMVFGYFGYLIGRGAFHRDLLDFVVAIAVVALYGSLIWGILPSAPSISWQGHLFGLIGGLCTAWWLRDRAAKTPVAKTR